MLDYDGYVASRALDYGSIRGTLVHWLARDVIWLDRWQGRPDSVIGETDVPTFRGLRERWAAQDFQMQKFLGDLTDSQLGETVAYVTAATALRHAQRLHHTGAPRYFGSVRATDGMPFFQLDVCSPTTPPPRETNSPTNTATACPR